MGARRSVPQVVSLLRPHPGFRVGSKCFHEKGCRMTKKYLEALAAAIARVEMPEASREALITEVSAVCAAMNPRFNAEVFRRAATPESSASIEIEEV